MIVIHRFVAIAKCCSIPMETVMFCSSRDQPSIESVYVAHPLVYLVDALSLNLPYVSHRSWRCVASVFRAKTKKKCAEIRYKFIVRIDCQFRLILFIIGDAYRETQVCQFVCGRRWRTTFIVECKTIVHLA